MDKEIKRALSEICTILETMTRSASSIRRNDMAKELTMYQCTLCMKIYSDRQAAEDCEASHYRAVRIVGADYSADSATGYPDSIGVEFEGGKVLRYDYAGGKWWRPKEQGEVAEAKEPDAESHVTKTVREHFRPADLATPKLKACRSCRYFDPTGLECKYDHNPTTEGGSMCCNYSRK